jgi:hypothetical protein
VPSSPPLLSPLDRRVADARAATVVAGSAFFSQKGCRAVSA